MQSRKPGSISSDDFTPCCAFRWPSRLGQIPPGPSVSISHRFARCPSGLSISTNPPPHSPHQPIDPSTIGFAGDSSGANLLYALLQIIRVTRQHPPITMHGHTVKFPIPFPAGLATLSFYGDPLASLPSYSLNRFNDLYLEIPWSHPSYPKCELWPTTPRSQIYATTCAHAHPFITPALPHDCRGMPPMWFAVGDEQFVDASRSVARRAAQQGVQVEWI